MYSGYRGDFKTAIDIWKKFPNILRVGGMSRRVRKQSLKSGGGRRFRKHRDHSARRLFPFGAPDFNASGSCRPPKGLWDCRFSIPASRFSDFLIFKFPDFHISRLSDFQIFTFQYFFGLQISEKRMRLPGSGLQGFSMNSQIFVIFHEISWFSMVFHAFS